MQDDERDSQRDLREYRKRHEYPNWVVGVAVVVAALLGAWFGYSSLADASRHEARAEGHLVGAAEAACWTDAILNYFFEQGTSWSEVSRTVPEIETGYLDSLDATARYGTGTDRRIAYEVFSVVGLQLGLGADSSLWFEVGYEGREVVYGGIDRSVGLEALYDTWFGRGNYRSNSTGNPNRWLSDFTEACLYLSYGPPDEG